MDGSMKERRTEEGVEEVLANPVYFGLGPYPPLIEPEAFIKAGVKLIEEIGAERYLTDLVCNLLKYLRYDPRWQLPWDEGDGPT